MCLNLIKLFEEKNGVSLLIEKLALDEIEETSWHFKLRRDISQMTRISFFGAILFALGLLIVTV